MGTGNIPTPDKINEIHKYIKDVVQSLSNNSAIPMVLYGGSVKSGKMLKTFLKKNLLMVL
jgi:Triosephosphate isomerase